MEQTLIFPFFCNVSLFISGIIISNSHHRSAAISPQLSNVSRAIFPAGWYN
ncbi:hypothetical protein CLOSTHATH_03605 [Hungatella hathewayi DSM 13479]|uniref:Uncharacterized protein n=1 Tax=Hungatella hathewayi DSM 13479 TaxID=566550 RepID=D3AJ15_9FIRM|nr:hypothetical protein CLOSTHATH_03605 [Hungatella hathewayi DSM 13479]